MPTPASPTPTVPHRARAVLVGVLAVLGSGLVPVPPARADGTEVRRVDTVFAVRRSTSESRVDYGMRLDGSCRPLGESPVAPYHRRRRAGRESTASLRTLELVAYGIRAQDVRPDRAGAGGEVLLRLRAVPDRRIRIVTESDGGRCRARPFTRVAGVDAELLDIFVVLDGPRSVRHVEITGRTAAGATVREILRD